MIVFPFSLFAVILNNTGIRILTGFYDSYELYPAQSNTFRYPSGVAFESGYNVPITGLFTGYSFTANFYFSDSYEDYSAGTTTAYPSGLNKFYSQNIYTSGKSFINDIYMSDSYERYDITGFDIRFNFTGYHSGIDYTNVYTTGHSMGGYLPPLRFAEILSIPNKSTYPGSPAFFTGSGILMTGDLDRISNTKIGYLGRDSGLFFQDHLLRLDRPVETYTGFTFEIALRRSGWSEASSRPFDMSSPSGTFLARFGTTDLLRAGVSGVADNANVTISDNQWTYVSFVRNGTNGTFYFSGRVANTITVSNVNISQYFPFYLGRRATNTPNDLPYWGYIDEFRFWNYVRTSGEIYSGSTGTVNPNSAGLVAYLSLDPNL
jgi:hypothetical protein